MVMTQAMPSMIWPVKWASVVLLTTTMIYVTKK